MKDRRELVVLRASAAVTLVAYMGIIMSEASFSVRTNPSPVVVFAHLFIKFSKTMPSIVTFPSWWWMDQMVSKFKSHMIGGYILTPSVLTGANKPYLILHLWSLAFTFWQLALRLLLSQSRLKLAAIMTSLTLT